MHVYKENKIRLVESHVNLLKFDLGGSKWLLTYMLQVNSYPFITYLHILKAYLCLNEKISIYHLSVHESKPFRIEHL